MRSISLLLALLFSLTCVAQKKTTFNLRGNVINFNQSAFRVYVTGYFNGTLHTIRPDSKGSFSRDLFTDGMQDVQISINNETITFFATPSDTINLSWDQNNFKNTFTVRSSSAKKQHQFNVIMAIYKNRTQPFETLVNALSNANKIPDSVKFRMINDSYNEELEILIKGRGAMYTDMKLMGDIYYKHINLQLRHRLLENYLLKGEGKRANPAYRKIDYNQLDQSAFHYSPLYRDFIFNRISNVNLPFKYYAASSDNLIDLNSPRRQYLLGEANLIIKEIRDWYLAKSLLDGFQKYKYDLVKPLYENYLRISQTPIYVGSVTAVYSKP